MVIMNVANSISRKTVNDGASIDPPAAGGSGSEGGRRTCKSGFPARIRGVLALVRDRHVRVVE